MLPVVVIAMQGADIQLGELTLTKKPGDTVSIGYDRAGHSAKATVTLAAQP